MWSGLIGDSIGTGPACALAREANPPDEIVLVTPFDTLAHVAAKRMWFLPVRWILKDRWDNVAALRHYRGPVRIYAAEYDTIIPNLHARALAKAIGVTPTMIPSGHNDWSQTGAVKL